MTDNARNYQNDLVPVMYPIICATDSSELNRFENTETAREKSIVYENFSIDMRHVHRYVREPNVMFVSPPNCGEPYTTKEVLEIQQRS